MSRFGAALVQLLPEEPHFGLYGPGFAVKISRTGPAAWYPGKPETAAADHSPSSRKPV